MNEAQTRFNKIDPKLRNAGWGIVPGSNILVEYTAEPSLSCTLSNALRNNPYMRDHITKWAALGARSEVIRLRDALCEAFGSEPAT